MLSSSPLIISLTLFALLGVTPAMAADGGIEWQGWSEAAFARAKDQNRFVLLDLGAVWCHWCHVMERDTYGNPAVADLIKARYVPVRVDQDARPDLSRRYEDYGWPATVVFSADGREIVKLRGYVPATRMIAVLEHILADPSPITYRDSLFDQLDISFDGWSSALSEPVRSALERRYLATHDPRRGGLLQLIRAEAAARFIGQTFMDGSRAGYLSAASGGVLKLRPNVEENIALARFANLLAWYTGDVSHRALAVQALRYLAIEDVATYRSTEPGILLADAELGGAPAHLTVIGPKGHAAARALHRAALRVPGIYRRIEWWDRAEGALPNADVAYPALDRPAAFFCAQGRCSLPVFKPGDLDALAARLGQAAGPMRASPR